MKTLLLSLIVATATTFAQAPMAQPPGNAPSTSAKPADKPKELAPEISISYLSMQVEALSRDVRSKDAQIKYLQTLLEETGASLKLNKDLADLTAKSGCDKIAAQNADNPAPACITYPKPDAAKK